MNRRSAHRLAWMPMIVLGWSAPAAASAGEIIAAKTGKVYHSHPRDCASARRIQPENRITFPSAKEAIRAGRRQCRRCEALDRKARAGKSEPDRSDGEPSTHPPEKARRDGVTVRPQSDRRDMSSRVSLPEVVGVAKVLEGGTLELDIGEKAVLLGIVFPQRGQPLAREAARFLTDQVRGRRLRIAYDDAREGGPTRDPLGRLRIYATPIPDGRDLGAELIFQGYAWLDRDRRFGRRAEFLRNEEAAWRDQRGIWKPTPDSEDDPEVITGRHAWEYHRPNCRHKRLMSDVLTMPLTEAQARRLVPCGAYRSRSKKS